VAFVVEEGKARVREVQIGLRTGGGGVEILSGLKPGEQVIVQGSDRLDDGVAVLAQDGGSGSASAKPTAASAEAGER